VHASDLQKWDGAPCAFTQLALSSSELLALGEDGRLYQFPADASAAAGLHPKAAALCEGERIAAVAASSLRVSVLTSTGKIATWLDAVCKEQTTVWSAAAPEPEVDGANGNSVLELSEFAAKAFKFDSVVQKIAVTDFGTAAVTQSGSVYWLGSRPWPLRQDRFKALQEGGHAEHFDRCFKAFEASLQSQNTGDGRGPRTSRGAPRVSSHRSRGGGGGGGRGGGRGGGGGGGGDGGGWTVVGGPSGFPPGFDPDGGFQPSYPGGYQPSVAAAFGQIGPYAMTADGTITRLRGGDEERTAPSLKELMALIGDENYYRSRLRRLGERTKPGKAFAALHKAFQDGVKALKVGDRVHLLSGKTPFTYRGGTRVLFPGNGKVMLGKLKENVDDITDSNKMVRVVLADGTTKAAKFSEIFILEPESRSPEGVLLKVDKERGVGLVRLAGKPAEDVAIVNLMQLAPRTELHTMFDSVLEAPVLVFDAKQMLTDPKGHNGVTFSEAYERYYDTFDGRGKPLGRDAVVEHLAAATADGQGNMSETQLSIFRNVLCRPDITDIQGSGWDINMTLRDATNTSVLYRWEANLRTGQWKLSPARWSTDDGQGVGQLCLARPAAAVETDSQAYLCRPAVPELPTVGCLASAAVLLQRAPGPPKAPGPPIWESRGSTDSQWKPFSRSDSMKLHEAHVSGQDVCAVGHCIVNLRDMSARDPRGSSAVRPQSLGGSAGNGTHGSLTLIGFSAAASAVGGVGCMGRTALHEAIDKSPVAVASLLASIDKAELARLAAKRDNAGATAFFAAMRRADVESALLILQRCKEIAAEGPEDFVTLACHPSDILGCPPVHALFGLCQHAGADRLNPEQSDENLPALLAALAKDRRLVGALDFAGNTVLEALTLATSADDAAVPCWANLLKAFVSAPLNALEDSIRGAVSAGSADDSKLDALTCSLASCAQCHAFAKELPQWLGDWAARSHGLDLSRAARENAKRMMQSVVRVFCAVYCSDAALEDQWSAAAGGFYTTFFRAVPSLAMEVLAKTANNVIEVVRLGLPLRSLPVGAIVLGAEAGGAGQTRPAAAKGADAGSIASIKDDGAVDCGKWMWTTGQPVPLQMVARLVRTSEVAAYIQEPSGERLQASWVTVATNRYLSAKPAAKRRSRSPPRDRRGLGASPASPAPPIQEGDTVELRPGLRSPSLRQGVPLGATGTVLAVDNYGTVHAEFAAKDSSGDDEDGSDATLDFDEDGEEDEGEEMPAPRGEEEDDEDLEPDEEDFEIAYLAQHELGVADGPRRPQTRAAWRGRTSDLVLAGASAKAAATAADPKVQRARVFRLCLQTIAVLHTEAGAVTAAALVAVAHILQPSWEHIFDCCDICEAGLQQAAAQRAAVRQMAVTQYMHAAYGVGCGAPEASQYAYVAVMLDALISLKQVGEHVVSSKPAREPDDGLAFTLTTGESSDTGNEELVRGVSFAYQFSTDPGSLLFRDKLVKRALGFAPSAASADYGGKHRIPRVELRGVLEYPTLRALYRWQRTVELLGEQFDQQGTLFRLLAPFEKKAARFRSRMEELLRKCTPEPVVKLVVRRGTVEDQTEADGTVIRGCDGCVADVVAALAAAREAVGAAADTGSPATLSPTLSAAPRTLPPLCQEIFEKSKFTSEIGQGKVRPCLQPCCLLPGLPVVISVDDPWPFLLRSA
jgi:hypothetical protein